MYSVRREIIVNRTKADNDEHDHHDYRDYFDHDDAKDEADADVF